MRHSSVMYKCVLYALYLNIRHSITLINVIIIFHYYPLVCQPTRSPPESMAVNVIFAFNSRNESGKKGRNNIYILRSCGPER